MVLRNKYILIFVALILYWNQCLLKKFNKSEKDFFVNISNTLRKIRNTTDMMEVHWDKDLENMASDFAQMCNELFEFDDKFEIHENKPVGITRYKLRSKKANLLVPVLSWYSRGYFYNFKSHLCNITKTCQYFTHVLRSSSESVGCGYGICGEAKKYAFVTCFYGNSEYECGKPLFTEGRSCTGCSEGYKCDNQLCVKDTKE